MAIDNTSPSPARKPLAVAVLIILYPFVIVGLMWFVIASFEDEDAPFFGVALITVFVVGNVLMNALLVYYRHKTRERWIRAEAAKWLNRRGRRKERHKAARLSLWLPSIIALWVLLFLPFATHVIHPSSHYLPNYRIPMPWAWTAVPVCFGDTCWVDAVISSKGRGRFGMTPFWPKAQLSMVSFGTTRSDYSDASDWRPRGVSQLTMADLNVGNMPLKCWQYVSPNDLFDRQLVGLGADVMAWSVVCGNRTFYANFFGRAEDLPAFYSVLRHTSPTS
jgi:hypothetical protein